MTPHFMDEDGTPRLSIHALIVETPQRRIMVDTCIGNDKPRPEIPDWSNLQLPFLGDLEKAGYSRESIDTVVCTHLHIDHVGWNTMLVDGKWVPTFPKARYLMGRHEFDYWQTEAETAGTQQGFAAIQAAVFSDSVKPVFDAGLVDLVNSDHRICDEVRLVPTFGHTPGHVSVRIESKGEKALITGDFTHHPCQLAHPDWATSVDFDQDASTATRRRCFRELAADASLVIGTHWSGPTAGHIVSDGAAYRLKV
jgi:glyoxylase-like metal-dependent hydrolase (beta-lactamase superfamily II)